MVKQFQVWIINLDPTIESEIKQTRPCVIISPNEMNRHLRTVIVAPMTTAVRGYPTRVSCSYAGKKGEVALDQISTIDKTRLVKLEGPLGKPSSGLILDVLQEMFKKTSLLQKS